MRAVLVIIDKKTEIFDGTETINWRVVKCISAGMQLAFNAPARTIIILLAMIFRILQFWLMNGNAWTMVRLCSSDKVHATHEHIHLIIFTYIE